MSSIRPLDVLSVRKLCSSQVVVTLGIAIKELIENSVDAGATNIEIRLKNYGADLIEVVDNGSGINEDDFGTLGKSHCTSKIKDFDDIYKIDYFGFRGEALFSLCQLADVSISTKTEGSKVGTRLEFNNSGDIKLHRPTARSRGTTVCVERLFHTLPVRRRHLTDQTHLLKEFSQAVTLISSYCLTLIGVHIACYRIDQKGAKTLVVSNMGGKSIPSNIAAVYGQIQIDSMVEIPDKFPISEELINEYNVKLSSEELDQIIISGFVSAPPMGNATNTGRSSGDRQFVYINGRPCDFQPFTRLATDIWRRCCRESLLSTSQSFGMPSRSITSAFPVLILLVGLPKARVDVNFSPDKRKLLLHWERAVLMKLKAALATVLGRGNDSQSIPVLPGAAAPTTLYPSPSSCSKRGSERLSQQPLISTHLASLPSSVVGVTKTSRSNSSPPPIVAKRPRVSSPPSCLFNSPKPVFASDSARRSYNRRLALLKRESVRVDFSIGQLLRYWAAKSWSAKTVNEPTTGEFRANLAEPAAESELTAIFRKEWFKDIRVIGQFNKGFIVCQRGDNLFIVDQHASDEKHRFEQLCANHQFTSQPLVVPHQLNLSAVQEHVLEENMDVFSKSGFAFSVNDNAPLGQRFRLISVPMSENKIFGHVDVEEMLSVMSEGFSRNCRPSRLRDILASRACRSAVMIGTALDRKQMARIVLNMSTMEHPWNCPHGRPTMRYLFHMGRLRQPK